MYSDKNYFLTKIDEAELDKLTGSVDANLDAAINAADSLIDSYVANVTATPLNPVPDIIKQFSYDLAIFFLHDRIQYNEIPQRVKDKYDAAINYLKDVASGRANIPGLTADEITETVQHEVNTPIMTRTSI